MQDVSLKTLLEAGCHFGHKTNRWHPKAAEYIYKAVGDTHIIDLVKTKEGLEKAAAFVLETVGAGDEVLFVGTKRQARGIVKDEASRVSAPYFSSRWIGGFLTNWHEVQKNVEKLKKLRKQVADKEEMKKYTKFERLMMEQEIHNLVGVYGGVEHLEHEPKALFIIDTRKEATAVAEGMRIKIPIVGVVDTNTDPTNVDYPIPANDDALGSVKLIVSYMADAYKEGKEKLAKVKAQQEAAEKKVVAEEVKK